MATRENPYASPQSTVEEVRLPPRLTIPRIIALLGIGGAGGAVMGALTNSINGALSPQFFRDVMYWYDTNVWASAVRLGVLEGAQHGFTYAIIFVGIIGGVSRRRCHFRTAVRYAGLTFVCALAFWILGGVIAVACARLFPDLCDWRLFGYSRSWPTFGYYAWVRGSYWGAVYGGLCSVFLTNALYAFRHRRAHRLEFIAPQALDT